jgi:hypothetical protein
MRASAPIPDVTVARDDEKQERRLGVLLLDDRSAVGAGAAPPQKQRSRERRLRPAVQLRVVQGDGLPDVR